MTEHDEMMRQAERRWHKEWGPEIHPWKRWLLAAIVICAFFGLIIGALLISPGDGFR